MEKLLEILDELHPDVDFETEERVDFSLSAPATVSVRGYGRFILRAFDGETRKGRLRLRADQLI